MKACCWHSLPSDLHAVILQFVTLRSLCLVREVNSTLKHIIDSRESIWKFHFSKFFGTTADSADIAKTEEQQSWKQKFVECYSDQWNTADLDKHLLVRKTIDGRQHVSHLPGGPYCLVRSKIPMSKGRKYLCAVEVFMHKPDQYGVGVGFSAPMFPRSGVELGSRDHSWGYCWTGNFQGSTDKRWVYGKGSTFGDGDIIAVEFDLTTAFEKIVRFYKNGVCQQHIIKLDEPTFRTLETQGLYFSVLIYSDNAAVTRVVTHNKTPADLVRTAPEKKS